MVVDRSRRVNMNSNSTFVRFASSSSLCVKHCAVYDFKPINSRGEAGVTEVKWLTNSFSNVTRSEPSSSCSPCSAWVTLLRWWLLSLCCWFEPREERGEGWKLYCYTGNTKVPIRTSNSQRLMKYKWYRGK